MGPVEREQDQAFDVDPTVATHKDTVKGSNAEFKKLRSKTKNGGDRGVRAHLRPDCPGFRQGHHREQNAMERTTLQCL